MSDATTDGGIAKRHARDLLIRLSAIRPEREDDIADLIFRSFEAVVKAATPTPPIAGGERERIARALYDHEFKSARVEYPSYDDPRTTPKCRERFLARAEAVLAALPLLAPGQGGKSGGLATRARELHKYLDGIDCTCEDITKCDAGRAIIHALQNERARVASLATSDAGWRKNEKPVHERETPVVPPIGQKRSRSCSRTRKRKRRQKFSATQPAWQ